MNENNPDDPVEAYLKGKMTQPDLENFERKIGSDPLLAQEVALRRAEMAASELIIASETRLLFREWQQGSPRFDAFWRNKPLILALGLFSGIFLLVAAIWIVRHTTGAPPADKSEQPSQGPPAAAPAPTPSPSGPSVNALPEKTVPPRHSAKYYRALAEEGLPEPVLSSLRKSAPDTVAADIFRRAQQAYETGDFNRTLDLLAQTDSSRLQSATFLAAHALFRLQRFGDAETRFNRLVGWNSRQFRFQSEWGVLMCRLADFPRREKEVRQQLNGILQHPEHPYFGQAKDLQKTLNE